MYVLCYYVCIHLFLYCRGLVAVTLVENALAMLFTLLVLDPSGMHNYAGLSMINFNRIENN